MGSGMTAEQGRYAATFVGAFTAVAGVAMLALPERTGALIGVPDAGHTRLLGVVDLALVPGLLAGRPRWPWLAARAVTNLGMAAFVLARGDRSANRARAFVAGLCVATAGDTRATIALRSEEVPAGT
jgi:hypothetical protein